MKSLELQQVIRGKLREKDRTQQRGRSCEAENERSEAQKPTEVTGWGKG